MKNPRHPLAISVAGGLALLWVIGLISCSTLNPTPRYTGFEKDIGPLFETNCLQCHNSRINHGNLILESRALALRPRPRGPVIIPGDPDASPLITAVGLPPTLDQAMPPTPHRLGKSQIALLRDWIAKGAPWPEGPAGALEAPAEDLSYLQLEGSGSRTH